MWGVHNPNRCSCGCHETLDACGCHETLDKRSKPRIAATCGYCGSFFLEQNWPVGHCFPRRPAHSTPFNSSAITPLNGFRDELIGLRLGHVSQQRIAGEFSHYPKLQFQGSVYLVGHRFWDAAVMEIAPPSLLTLVVVLQRYCAAA